MRAGFGLFYDLGSDEADQAYADSFPFIKGRAIFNSTFPATATEALLPALNAGGSVDVPFSAFDPQLKLPYTLKWSFSVGRALGSNQTISAAYAGAAGEDCF